LSDLGTGDKSLSAAKVSLMNHVPATSIVDISNDVAPYDLQQAAYILTAAYKNFPPGTIHLLLVDIFSADTPQMLLAEKDGSFFIAPDNGILPFTFGDEFTGARLCKEFSKPLHFSDWIREAGSMITLIDKKELSRFPICELNIAKRQLQLKVVPLGIDCNIRCIDRYDNVVLDVTRPQFDQHVRGRPFKIRIMRMEDVTTVSNNYNDVPQGKPLCRFNDSGYLEIALNHGSAAAQLGLGSYSTGNIGYQSIRIFF